MNTHGIHKIQQQGSYLLIPSLYVGGATQEEFRPTRGIVQLDNGLVIRHVEIIKSFLQRLLNIINKYAKTVSDDVVVPMLEIHIVQTLPSKTAYGLQVGAFVLPAKRDYTITEMDG